MISEDKDGFSLCLHVFGAQEPGIIDAGMLRLERVDPEHCDWPSLDAFDDRVLFQTKEWLAFLTATQHGELVLAAVEDGESTVGYFTGLVVRRYGVRILGSPFVGWTTATMGFNLEPGVDRRAALEALVPFAFRDLECVYLELRDRKLGRADIDAPGWDAVPERTLMLDLTPPEEELLAQMTSERRHNVRYAERHGVFVEEANDIDFADDYYAQLEEVFARQSLVPTYDVGRVRELIRHVHPSEHLLLLRARNPDGRCVATALVPAFNDTAYFWGGASWREHTGLRPNEALVWYAMTYWKRRGIRQIDLGAGAKFKRSFGRVVEVDIPRVRRSRSRLVGGLRDVARHAFHASQHARGRLRAVAAHVPTGHR